jgi:uncharacterized protein YqeY
MVKLEYNKKSLKEVEYMISDDIKKANVQAMRDKDVVARNIFGVVMNKILLETIKKRETKTEMTDADVVQILLKTIKELNEEKEGYQKVKNQVKEGEIQKQIEIVNTFLPKMLTQNDIKDIISKMEDKSIPAIMKKFKTEYAGKCNMGDVNAVAKSFQ